MAQKPQPKIDDNNDKDMVPVTLYLQPDISRAFRRCVWSITYETGKSQLEIMNEMVHDFLIKNGC